MQGSKVLQVIAVGVGIDGLAAPVNYSFVSGELREGSLETI